MVNKEQLIKIINDHRGIHPTFKATLLSDIQLFENTKECESYIEHHLSQAETMTDYEHYQQEEVKPLIPDFIKRIEKKAIKNCEIAILKFPEDIKYIAQSAIYNCLIGKLIISSNIAFNNDFKDIFDSCNIKQVIINKDCEQILPTAAPVFNKSTEISSTIYNLDYSDHTSDFKSADWGADSSSSLNPGR